MPIHFDQRRASSHTPTTASSLLAVEREFDGEVFWFCDEDCLQRGRHLTCAAAEDEVDRETGPAAGGDLDEPEL